MTPRDPAPGTRRTPRLRLEPVDAGRAGDLWLVQGDDAVWPWYGDSKPSRDAVERRAAELGESWRHHGVHKWIAYDRESGEVVGRGGLSRVPLDDDWGQVHAFLPPEPWARAAYEDPYPYLAHADWLELGWALRHSAWGHGYAAEIGRAGLAYAFDVLGVRAVVSCTVRHNARSRAVMERIGMRYVGEIRSPGQLEVGGAGHDEVPYALCVLLREEATMRPARSEPPRTGTSQEPGGMAGSGG